MTNTANGLGLVAGGFNQDHVAVYPPKEAVDAVDVFDYVRRPPDTCLDSCRCRRPPAATVGSQRTPAAAGR